MKLTKIEVQNFKSIKEIDFDIKKYGSSYTTMLLGINESGKSNVLEAMSFLDTPTKEFDYYEYHNQKDEDGEPVDLWFSLAFEQKETCPNELRKGMEGGDLLTFEVSEIVKNVYLQKDETKFSESFDFKITKIPSGLYVSGSGETFKISKTKEDDSFRELTTEVFKELFSQKVQIIIKKYVPPVIFWKPSEEYLISTEDLNSFAENSYSKPALRNIFLLAGYKNTESIKAAVATIANGQHRSRLTSKLQTDLDAYIKKVWKHNIDIIIDITETGQFTLSIKDSGEENKHDRLSIAGRSEGARHFLSLILSLSIENKNESRKSQLILIDEPEAHLHPSGIRDLRDELLNIGTNNHLFVSTHSPFLVDRKKKERNIIIRKNSSALTEKVLIDSESSVIDDEVLREAFGLEVYKDLLNPHSILVEGSSDKKILAKVLELKGKNEYGITNGHGSNIDTLASKLNDVDISVLVVVDDDAPGKIYKTKIVKIGGSFSATNVFTIRDLVGSVIDGATIEDMLGKGYVESTFKSAYKEFYSETECDIELDEAESFIKQMKAHLSKNDKEEADKFIESVKDKLATDLQLTKASFAKNFPLLNELGDHVIAKLSA